MLCGYYSICLLLEKNQKHNRAIDMTEEQRLIVLACGWYFDFQELFNQGYDEKAALALYKSKLADTITEVTLQLKDRLIREKMPVKSKNLFLLIQYWFEFSSFFKWFKKDFSDLLSRAGDLASDDKFKPRLNLQEQISLKSAINEVIADELEIRGL